MFTVFDTKTPLPLQEEAILSFWKQHSIVEKTIEEGKKRPVFSFYDGPPFATGLPHYGHLLVGTIKDCVLRYKYMKGFAVSRRFGWDCHGLPIENEIEKVKNLSGVSSIEAFGIADFNEACREIVLRYTNEWKSTVSRFGRWVDFSDVYHTMDPSFMESVWWVFAELWKKGLIYEGFKVMPYSAKLGTPLSNFEASENYKEVDDPSIVVALSMKEDPSLHLLIWTTTPWTLPSNLAVVAHPDFSYAIVEHRISKNKYIIAESRLESVWPDPADYTKLDVIKGHQLLGKEYVPLFPYFASYAGKGAFRVLNDVFVTTENGTGLVHAAPGFGEDDFYVCQKAHIPVVCPVDQNGLFTDEISPYVGRFVKDCDKEIIKELKAQKRILVHESIRHRYPFCWRSDTPLIYKAVSTWFVAVEKIKEALLASNAMINWVPEHIKFGRFGKWLENARDWAISRNRYWGTPIPVWRSEDGDCIVVESKKMLEELTGHSAEDLHRHFIDHATITKSGKVYKRIPEVFDCWFESGSMPYAQHHYPFENKELLTTQFPADFIAEALDQTRGWFYTLTVLSTALFNKPAFKNVVVNGIVLAEDGNKMSKRLKNYPDPLDVVSKYGADAIRLYMLSSPAVHADDMCFSEAGVELTLRSLLIPLLNAVSFFTTYARIYSWNPGSQLQPRAELDRWIVSMTEKLIFDVSEKLDAYDLSGATGCLQPFMDYLTNWYIRSSRRRFWSSEETSDRNDAFATLYYVLKTFVRVAAPFAPFTTELVWQALKNSHEQDSVHLEGYPKAQFPRDLALERAQELALIVTQMAHALRKNVKIKVRQPLPKAFVVCSCKEDRALLQTVVAVVADEINVKEIDFLDDDHSFVHLHAKPNFRVLGKRFGKRLPEVQKALLKVPYAKLAAFSDTGKLDIHLEDGGHYVLENQDVEVVRTVREGVVALHEAGITVALDTHISDDLLIEGRAREVINKLNTARRDNGFAVTDRIDVFIEGTENICDAIKAYLAYIHEEALIKNLYFKPHPEATVVDINGEEAKIFIMRVE